MMEAVRDAEKQADGELFKTFEDLGYKPTDEEIQELKKAVRRITNVRLKVGVFGQTGMGKSSLCNALFGAEISKVGHGVSMTRKVNEADVDLGNGAGITLLDFPGLGEDEDRDVEYKALYREVMPNVDLVLWLLSVNDRKNKDDIAAYKEIVLPIAKENGIPVIFVANKADAAHPNNWDASSNAPSAEQRETIETAVYGSFDEEGSQSKGFVQKFEINEEQICIVSADKGYGLVGLVETIVRFLPAHKKFGFVREAKKETVSPKAEVAAREGFFETIKKEVIKIVKEKGPVIAVMAGKALVALGVRWLKKKI